jgi:hypothetical protein
MVTALGALCRVAPESGEVATRVLANAEIGAKKIAPTTTAITLTFFMPSYSSKF